jgi:hypothetical protein
MAELFSFFLLVVFFFLIVFVFDGVTLSCPKLITDCLTSGSNFVYLLVFDFFFNITDLDLEAPSSPSSSSS